jgi:Ca2+-binding RTX toxin-like protein
MAKPIMGTNGTDVLVGTNGADDIQGKGGDDVITGGKGNDSIDGGQGTDTAVYSGNYEDYVLTFKGTGNDKVTIADTVANRDGTDQLKQVEFAKFNDAVVNLRSGDTWHYHVNATLDDSAQDPRSGAW